MISKSIISIYTYVSPCLVMAEVGTGSGFTTCRCNELPQARFALLEHPEEQLQVRRIKEGIIPLFEREDNY